MDNNFLATYKENNDFKHAWFGTEEEALEWVDTEAENYSNVEVVEIRVINVLYEKV